MERKQLIETGNRLELRRIRRTGVEEEVAYVSRFLYQQSEDEAVIEMPAKEGHLAVLEPGEAFQVCFYTHKGLYRCQVQVTSRHYEDKLPVVVIKFRSEFERLQRRQHYRMECFLDMEFGGLEEEELDQLLWEKNNAPGQAEQKEEQKEEQDGEAAKEEGESLKFHTGMTLDISGGGVRFNADYQAADGSVIAMKIAFPPQEIPLPQLLFAKVLTVLPVPNHTGKYEHRVQFIYITNAERERIIRYIFLEERKRRQRQGENKGE